MSGVAAPGEQQATGTRISGEARLFAIVMLPVIALVAAFLGFAELRDEAAIAHARMAVARSAEPVLQRLPPVREEVAPIAMPKPAELQSLPPVEVATLRGFTNLIAVDAMSTVQQAYPVPATEGMVAQGALAEQPIELSTPMPESVGVRDAAPGAAYARLTISDVARGLQPARAGRSCFNESPEPMLAAAQGVGPLPDFGTLLARAALRQTRDFVFYTDRYFPISYPGGDIPPLYGVCSDVVVRAFRALGIDLQLLVHESGVGIGDRSIDHRRVSVLKRFFAKYAEELHVADRGDSYRPGDIVTYFRPRNTGTRTHIAVVSERIGPSGNPMIIHNRGNGVQLEDALFGDPITGHFRYGRGAGRVAEIDDGGSAIRSRVTALNIGVHGPR